MHDNFTLPMLDEMSPSVVPIHECVIRSAQSFKSFQNRNIVEPIFRWVFLLLINRLLINLLLPHIELCNLFHKIVRFKTDFVDKNLGTLKSHSGTGSHK